jgi:hypothetical protein
LDSPDSFATTIGKLRSLNFANGRSSSHGRPLEWLGPQLLGNLELHQLLSQHADPAAIRNNTYASDGQFAIRPGCLSAGF